MYSAAGTSCYAHDGSILDATDLRIEYACFPLSIVVSDRRWSRNCGLARCVTHYYLPEGAQTRYERDIVLLQPLFKTVEKSETGVLLTLFCNMVSVVRIVACPMLVFTYCDLQSPPTVGVDRDRAKRAYCF